MANQSSITLQKKVNHRPKDLKIATGLSKSFVDEGNKLGFCFSGYPNSLELKNKNSSRILGSEMNEVNQDHKRRCLEKLVVRREQMTQQNVEDGNCALEVEVIDDTALIEATAAVTRFKNRNRKETDLGFGKNRQKEENEGKKKRNKGFKKQGSRCSMKCVNEKKLNVQVVEDKSTSGKKIQEGKGQKGCRKMSAKVKYVYQKKDTKNQKLVDTGGEEDKKVENQNVVEEIVGEVVKETDVSMNVSVGDEKESTTLIETDGSLNGLVGNEKESTTLIESDVSLKVSVRDDKESNIKLDEIEAVNVKDDGLKLDPQIDAVIQTEVEDQNVSASTTVGLKKTAYTRAEMEALRFVDEPGQKAKWAKVYGGFESHVAREYTGLLVDVSDRPPRYRHVVNCGYIGHANPILGMPPVLPLCSPSNHRKFDRAVSFN